MFGNSTPRPYIVTIRHWPDRSAPAHEDHDVEVSAYDLAEAMVQASMKLKTDAGIGGESVRTEFVGIRPKAAPSIEDLLKVAMGERVGSRT